MGLIELKNIHYAYPDGTTALNNLSLTIGEGKKIAVLGENGAGKSTLFLLLNGIYEHTSGDYFFRKEKITYTRKQKKELIKNVGVIFQDPELQLFASTVLREISIGPLNLSCTREEVEHRVDQAMRKTDIEQFKNKLTYALSCGEKKRVTIAAILAMSPSVIVLDEPLAWIDNTNSRRVIAILDRLAAEQKTVIISTHNSAMAYEWADYIFVMKNGTIAGQGKPDDVFLDEDLIRDAGLEVPLLVSIAKRIGLERLPVDEEDLYRLLEL